MMMDAALIRRQLNPLSSRLSPLRAFTAWRLEQYYARTLTDLGLAQRWSAHYLSGLRLPVAAHILDYGCGRGRHVALLSQLGHRVIGLDRQSHPWWHRIHEVFPDHARCQVIWPRWSSVDSVGSGYDLLVNVGVIHGMTPTALEQHAIVAQSVIKSQGYWLLIEANSEGLGAQWPLQHYGRLHALSDVIRIAARHGFTVVDQWYEGVYASYCPQLINFLRQQCWPGPYVQDDFGSWLEAQIAPRDRALWCLRLQRC